MLDNEDDSHLPAPSPPYEPDDDNDLENYYPQQDSDLNMDFGPYEGEFNFLPPDIGAAGPSQQMAENWILQGATKTPTHPILDDEDDKWVIQIDEDAGRIYQHEPPPRHFQLDKDGDSSMDNNGKPNPFFPFASELDWRVAQWAVKDGPGHSAFNQLLEIPGVSKFNWYPFTLYNFT